MSDSLDVSIEQLRQAQQEAKEAHQARLVAEGAARSAQEKYEEIRRDLVALTTIHSSLVNEFGAMQVARDLARDQRDELRNKLRDTQLETPS